MRKKDKEFDKDWVKEVKSKLKTDEDLKKIKKFDERINRESSYSKALREIENIMKKH